MELTLELVPVTAVAPHQLVAIVVICRTVASMAAIISSVAATICGRKKIKAEAPKDLIAAQRSQLGCEQCYTAGLVGIE